MFQSEKDTGSAVRSVKRALYLLAGHNLLHTHTHMVLCHNSPAVGLGPSRRADVMDSCAFVSNRKMLLGFSQTEFCS